MKFCQKICELLKRLSGLAEVLVILINLQWGGVWVFGVIFLRRLTCVIWLGVTILVRLRCCSSLAIKLADQSSDFSITITKAWKIITITIIIMMIITITIIIIIIIIIIAIVLLIIVILIVVMIIRNNNNKLIIIIIIIIIIIVMIIILISRG